LATSLNQLSARPVATIVKPERHADGGNLYLLVSKTGAKSWVFEITAKADELGLLNQHPLLTQMKHRLIFES
jgi:hypothetical protein